MTSPDEHYSSALFIDNEKQLPKSYEEISHTKEWKNLTLEDRLGFIHNYINPGYLKEPIHKASSDIRFKKTTIECTDEYEDPIKTKLKIVAQRDEEREHRIESDRNSWAIEYENLLRQKVFWKLKSEIEQQRGGKKTVKFLERKMVDLKIINSNDPESLLLLPMLKEELDFWTKSEDCDEDDVALGNSVRKLKWNATPSIFGYLITELVKQGFIEPPLYGGEINYTGLAKICYNLFDVGSTQENIIKEVNPSKSSLSDVKRAKFTIPNLSDLQ